MAFIDGMHLFEYALRDFINVEKYSSKNTIVVIDDIFPGSSAQAARDRRTRAWTGDVWKLLLILRNYRPDLELMTLNASPTGLLCITNMNPYCTILEDAYDRIVEEWVNHTQVPDMVLSRSGALSCNDPAFEMLLTRLRDTR
jgi:hypothetical protein